MEFSFNLDYRHSFLLEHLIAADNDLRLDEYKVNGTGIGNIKEQIVEKDIFKFVYLDKTFYPNQTIKSVFVVKKESYLELSKRQLGIKYYGWLSYYKKRIYYYLVNHFSIVKRLNSYLIGRKNGETEVTAPPAT